MLSGVESVKTASTHYLLRAHGSSDIGEARIGVVLTAHFD